MQMQNVMTILYVNRGPALGDTGKVLKKRGHNLVSRNRCADAWVAILTGTFDVVVIEDGDEDLETLDFTVKAHQMEPTLPIFVAKNWGSDLPEAIEEFANLGNVTEDDMPCCL